MDAIFMSSSAEKSVSPNKNNVLRRYSSGANFISKQNGNLLHNTSIIHGGGGGLLFAPPPSLSFSYNPSAPPLNPLFYQNYQQPPLLPLPVPNKPPHTSLPSRTRSLSSSPPNVKNNKHKDPKRSKSKQLTGKSVEEPNKLQPKPTVAKKTQALNKPFAMASAKASGSVPNDTPKVGKDLDSLSSSIFMLSPPPSSLPLPSFWLRPKLSCNAEAASVDDGATDNLRRFLRLP
ncbi:putative TFIIB zinc-binding protein [Hibiscus syriacus]|uniref:TFIIB zinc-binding protein n=1 Tax=Hibiscus syriacus TaxID=106335 RepID=A0A6A3BXM4_HIBSY|nr:putative TFIIB zinc-binding protein [Hibiscus syriacus]